MGVPYNKNYKTCIVLLKYMKPQISLYKSLYREIQRLPLDDCLVTALQKHLRCKYTKYKCIKPNNYINFESQTPEFRSQEIQKKIRILLKEGNDWLNILKKLRLEKDFSIIKKVLNYGYGIVMNDNFKSFPLSIQEFIMGKNKDFIDLIELKEPELDSMKIFRVKKLLEIHPPLPQNIVIDIPLLEKTTTEIEKDKVMTHNELIYKDVNIFINNLKKQKHPLSTAMEGIGLKLTIPYPTVSKTRNSDGSNDNLLPICRVKNIKIDHLKSIKRSLKSMPPWKREVYEHVDDIITGKLNIFNNKKSRDFTSGTKRKILRQYSLLLVGKYYMDYDTLSPISHNYTFMNVRKGENFMFQNTSTDLGTINCKL